MPPPENCASSPDQSKPLTRQFLWALFALTACTQLPVPENPSDPLVVQLDGNEREGKSPFLDEDQINFLKRHGVSSVLLDTAQGRDVTVLSFNEGVELFFSYNNPDGPCWQKLDPAEKFAIFDFDTRDVVIKSREKNLSLDPDGYSVDCISSFEIDLTIVNMDGSKEILTIRACQDVTAPKDAL